MGYIAKTRQNEIKKFVKLTGYTYDLQQFDELLIPSASSDRKRKLCESAETFLEKLVKPHRVSLFLAGFSYLELQCAFTHVSLSSGSFLFSSALHASFLAGYSAKLKRERDGRRARRHPQ